MLYKVLQVLFQLLLPNLQALASQVTHLHPGFHSFQYSSLLFHRHYQGCPGAQHNAKMKLLLVPRPVMMQLSSNHASGELRTSKTVPSDPSPKSLPTDQFLRRMCFAFRSTVELEQQENASWAGMAQPRADLQYKLCFYVAAGIAWRLMHARSGQQHGYQQLREQDLLMLLQTKTLAT